MLYCLSKEEIQSIRRAYLLPEFTNAEILTATYVTDKKSAREFLPKPLSLPEVPQVTVFVARYPETNFGCIYNEGALFLHCDYKNERGIYCLSMPVDDDMAMVGGREQFGYPKKMADRITLEKADNHVIGSVVRKKEEILRIECDLIKELPTDFVHDTWVKTQDWDGKPCYRVVSFLHKYFPSPDGMSFDYLPRLIREPLLFRKQGVLLEGRGEVKVSSSAFDQLGSLPVKDIKAMIYGIWHNTMLPGKVIRRVWNPFGFLKHAFARYDFVHTVLQNYDPSSWKRARKTMKAAKKI